MVCHHDHWRVRSLTWSLYSLDIHSRVLLRSGHRQLHHQSSKNTWILYRPGFMRGRYVRIRFLPIFPKINKRNVPKLPEEPNPSKTTPILIKPKKIHDRDVLNKRPHPIPLNDLNLFVCYSKLSKINTKNHLIPTDSKNIFGFS